MKANYSCWPHLYPRNHPSHNYITLKRQWINAISIFQVLTCCHVPSSRISIMEHLEASNDALQSHSRCGSFVRCGVCLCVLLRKLDAHANNIFCLKSAVGFNSSAHCTSLALKTHQRLICDAADSIKQSSAEKSFNLCCITTNVRGRSIIYWWESAVLMFYIWPS